MTCPRAAVDAAAEVLESKCRIVTVVLRRGSGRNFARASGKVTGLEETLAGREGAGQGRRGRGQGRGWQAAPLWAGGRL